MIKSIYYKNIFKCWNIPNNLAVLFILIRKQVLLFWIQQCLNENLNIFNFQLLNAIYSIDIGISCNHFSVVGL